MAGQVPANLVEGAKGSFVGFAAIRTSITAWMKHNVHSPIVISDPDPVKSAHAI